MGTDQQGLIRVITIKAERGGTVLGTTDTVLNKIGTGEG